MTPTKETGAKSTTLDSIAESTIILLTVIIAFLPLGMLIFSSNSGFDLTDEGSYLNWISNPWPYKVSDTQFGFIYHPFYRLLAGNVSLLRQVNILITTLLAFALCSTLIQKLWPERSPSRITELRLVGLGFALSTSCLVYIPWGLVTPSYNSLALQSLLVAALGIVWAHSEASRTRVAGWIFIGVGGWLAFMAKPTTALALGTTVGLYLLLSKEFRLGPLSLSVATAVLLFIVSGYVIDGSTTGFIHRFLAVAEEGDLRGSRNYLNILFTGNLDLANQDLAVFVAFIFTIFLTTFIAWSERAPQKIIWAALAGTIALGGALLCALLASDAGHFAIGQIQFKGFWQNRELLIAAVLIGLVLGCFPAIRSGVTNFRVVKNFTLALCFATFPYAFAMGTTNNYWNAMSAAGFFWVLAGILILGSLRQDTLDMRKLATLAAGVELVTISLVCVGMEYPYRQPQPLRLNKDRIMLGATETSVVVAGSTGDYIKLLQKLSYDNGFTIGDPMIDLTGVSPGVLFALGARSIGYAWLNGGYPGSAKMAAARLDLVPCEELSRAWLLIEPSGRWKLPDHILTRYGIDIETDFKLAGVVSRPASPWNGPQQDQQLLKPTRPPGTALEHCRQMKLALHPG